MMFQFVHFYGLNLSQLAIKHPCNKKTHKQACGQKQGTVVPFCRNVTEVQSEHVMAESQGCTASSFSQYLFPFLAQSKTFLFPWQCLPNVSMPQTAWYGLCILLASPCHFVRKSYSRISRTVTVRSSLLLSHCALPFLLSTGWGRCKPSLLKLKKEMKKRKKGFKSSQQCSHALGVSC